MQFDLMMSLTFRRCILEGIRLRTLAIDLWSSSPLSLCDTLTADPIADRHLPGIASSDYGTAAQCACAATPHSSLTFCLLHVNVRCVHAGSVDV